MGSNLISDLNLPMLLMFILYSLSYLYNIMNGGGDPALLEVQEQLKALESILKAEAKRRVESNEIMQEYILNYLNELETTLGRRVN